MASPTPRKRPQSDLQDPFSRYPPRPPRTGPPELVNPSFLLKAGGLTLAAALTLAWLSVCLLVWQGGWQHFLHPSHAAAPTPASLGIPFQPIPFDAAETGKPRLSAWWLPSDSADATTILYLHDGDGSLPNALADLALLHQSGVNLFAIDYRGYGQSAGPHPTEQRMQEDASAALDYLVNTRHIPAARIVPYGVGLGGVLAARLAASHPDLPALIVDRPHPDAYLNAVADPHTRLLPMRLLLQDHFDIDSALADAHQPKLLIANAPETTDPGSIQRNQKLFRGTPGTRKTTVTFDRVPAQSAYVETLRRFLDEALPRPASATSNN